MRPLCSGGLYKPIAVIPNPRNQIARLLLGKAVFLRGHFIVLIGSHFATVGLANLALVVWHSSNATTGNAALFPMSPPTMPDEYAAAIQEMIQAKVENRAPEVVVATEGKPETAVINIMDALKESMQAKGRAKVRDTVLKRMGKQPRREPGPRPARPRPSARRTAH